MAAQQLEAAQGPFAAANHCEPDARCVEHEWNHGVSPRPWEGAALFHGYIV
jgi:hypothetical protein